MIVSVFTYNGETAILKLHLSILAPYVDRFIIVEANKTFTGNEKPLYFFRDQRFFKPWWKQIDYFVMDDWDDTQLWEKALSSPHTKGASHWKREFYIKESIQKALIKFNVQEEDTLFIGDVDEIINPSIEFVGEMPVKAKLRVYTYYLNNASSEEFWGTLICKYADIKDKCLNDMRNDAPKSHQFLGWHFTSMGGVDMVQRKLNDSYTHESYNMNFIPGHVEKSIKQRTDLLMRPFTYELDETYWPDYLKKYKREYKNLLCQ